MPAWSDGWHLLVCWPHFGSRLLLQGFRRYDRIKETLCHELAHMVWGEHDASFKALNSQLLRESTQLDWTAQTGMPRHFDTHVTHD